VRQIRDRGIVAVGTFTSEVYPGVHWNDPKRTANYADIEFTTYLLAEDRLPTEVLVKAVPAVPWNNLYGSGVQLDKSDEARLAAVWLQHLDSFRSGLRPAEELLGDETFVEGAASKVVVNRYERDPVARERCLQIHGRVCAVCGFDFQKTYGTLGDGFIHVHHIREVSTLPPGYRVKPKDDLVPVCANCHAMLHRCRPALTPDELRVIVKNARS
jgi:5-methylcytosine-specific restriction protein A